MAGLFEAITEQARKLICAALKPPGALAGQITELLYGEDSPQARAAQQFFSGGRFCDPPPPPQTTPDTGEPLCPCKLYDFSITYNYTTTGGNPGTGTEVRTEVAGPITFRYFLVNTTSGGVETFRLQYLSAIKSQCPNVQIGVTDLAQFAVRPGTKPTFTVNSLTPSPGQPAGCGDVPPPPPPLTPYDPSDYTYDIDIFYDERDTGDIYIIPVRFTLGEINFNANLDLVIPVNINLKPQFNFDPNLDINFDLDFNFNTGDINIRPPTPPDRDPPRLPPPPKYDPPGSDDDDPSPPPTPPDVPDPPPQDDDPQLRRVIVGAIVTVNDPMEASKVGQLGQDSNPDVFYPDLGLVSFQIRHRRGVGWTEDIRVKNVRQFIPCPWGGGAIDVKGTPRDNATMTVTPVYGYPEERLVTT